MITRTTIYAEVTGERIYKEGIILKSEPISLKIPKCDTLEKSKFALR